MGLAFLITPIFMTYLGTIIIYHMGFGRAWDLALGWLCPTAHPPGGPVVATMIAVRFGVLCSSVRALLLCEVGANFVLGADYDIGLYRRR